MKQRELSNWIKGVAILGSACVLFAGWVVAPDFGHMLSEANPNYAGFYWPCVIFIWVTAVPVLAVAVLAWLIAADIGRDNSFCLQNAKRLRIACVMAVTDTALYLLAGVVLAALNALHPAILLLIMGICGVGVACAVVFAALSHLTRKAVDMKSENDLTI